MQIEPVGITAYASQSAGQNILKGQNGTLNVTLDEMSLIKFIKEKPKATQKEIAAHIGKSERTIKRMTSRLAERGVIERKNGRRNGFWEIMDNKV